MIRDRDGWLSRLKAVEREWVAMRLAASRLLEQAQGDITVVAPHQIGLRDIEGAGRNLDRTYLIRLFAEFETGLRRYWATVRTTHPPARDLLDGVAAQRNIPVPLVEQAHGVREFRYALVHERHQEMMNPPTLREARSILCRFGSRLPESWT